MTDSITVNYFLGNKERLFDLGQGIYANKALIMKKGGGKVRAFSRMLQKMKTQAVLFFVLAAVQAALMVLDGVSVMKSLLLLLCAIFGGVMAAVWKASSKSYREALDHYRQTNGAGGAITFDESGITEQGDGEESTHFDWTEYVACVICPETIVILSTRPVMLIVEHTRETRAGVSRALTAHGRADTIYEVEVRERSK